MSKKDYVILARAIKQARENIAQCTTTLSGPGAVDYVADTIAGYLVKDNARFDLVKFLKATK